MPETRYIIEISYPEGTPPEEKTPDNPNAIITQMPCEVSDAQLLLGQIAEEISEANDQALVAYNLIKNKTWAGLTDAQRNILVKVVVGLLGDYIVRHPEKYGV